MKRQKKLINPNELSTEELLKALEQNESKESLKTNVIDDYSVFNFIQVFNLKKGSNRVSVKLIRKLYIKWSGINISSNAFNKQFGLVFNIFSHKKDCYLNNKAFNILETIKQSSSNRVTYSKIDKRHVERFEFFIKENNITPGVYYIEAKLLEIAFNNWCKNNRKKGSRSSKNFNSIADLYFNKKVNNHVIYFCVSENIEQLLTKEFIQLWRKVKIKTQK